MSNSSISCPGCGGAMSVPPDMAGMTVACAHCKQPFQIPDIAPSVFAQQIPEGPRRRSPGRSPGSNPWIWLGIGLPCAGVLVALLFLWRGDSGMMGSLEKGQINQMYEEITRGMTPEEAEKRVRALMAKLPGSLREDTIEDDDPNKIQKVFEKGKVRIILFINLGTDKLVNKDKSGF